MRRRLSFVALALFGLTAVVVAVLWLWESEHHRKFKRIQPGMTQLEVEAILGPGEAVPQETVPSVRGAVNSDDPRASEERARREGRSPMTARDYPTRSKFVVEGDVILVWENRETREWIYVALKDGQVCEKYFRTLNYL